MMAARFHRLCGALCVAASCVLSAGQVRADDAQREQGLALFAGGVRVALVQHCGACHTGEEVEGEFDLTTRDSLLKGGLAGAAILPGKSAESLLVKMLRHERKPVMPKDADPLPKELVDRIAKWVDLGAPYDAPLVKGAEGPPEWTRRVVSPEGKSHWAYQPLRNDPVPEGTAAHPIDRFLDVARNAAGLKANPESDRATLFRRLSFDLVGLPPTPEETAEFVKDASPDAVGNAVDRLLASPHFGERWGRHWLDLARFAESHGFEHDYDRPSAYHYRDFVIESFNRDMPYDEFVRLQIAGDVLAKGEPGSVENRLAWMATGYLAAGVHSTQITANEVEKHRYDELDDIVATLTTSFLGLTLGCARCHDHKFDALPQADYYRMVSAFTRTVRSEKEFDFDPEGYQRNKQAWDLAHAPFEETVRTFEKERLPARLAEWERDVASTEAAALSSVWSVLAPKELVSKGKAVFEPQADGSFVVTGPNIDHDEWTITSTLPAGTYEHLRLETLPHDSLPQKGPGRAGNGNFALSVFQASVRPVDAAAESDSRKLKLVNPRATFEQNGLPVAAAIDDNPQSAWAVDPQFGKPHAAVFDFAEPLILDAPSTLTLLLQFNNNVQHGIGHPRFSIGRGEVGADLFADGWPLAVREALATPADKRTKVQRTALVDWYKPRDAEWQALRKKEQEHAATAPKPDLRKVLVSGEDLPAVRLHTQGGDFFEQSFFLRRGDVGLKDGVATAGFPQVLVAANVPAERWFPAVPEGTKDRRSPERRAVAAWMTDTEAGAGQLLARVIVNRLWRQHFGRGLVATPSDFGVKGEKPSHPELLDWLARRLIADGWSLKKMHRLMLTSAAYRQSSAADPERLSADRENKFVWRFSPRRLEAEIIRDSLLSVSGLLDQRLFGPGTLDANQRRRSIYFTVKRSQLVPMMQVFDCPDGLSGLAERPATTIAPQALLLLNNDLVRAAAEGLAQRSVGGDPEARIRKSCELAVGRTPDSAEIEAGKGFVAARGGDEAAWRDYCQVLLCLNEFVFVE
jgi:mono/diheme cytochrome c family protein